MVVVFFVKLRWTIFPSVDPPMKHFDFCKPFSTPINTAKVTRGWENDRYLIAPVLVCPAGWHPGSDTIIPNPEEKLKYFSKNYEPKKNWKFSLGIETLYSDCFFVLSSFLLWFEEILVVLDIEIKTTTMFVISHQCDFVQLDDEKRRTWFLSWSRISIVT